MHGSRPCSLGCARSSHACNHFYLQIDSGDRLRGEPTCIAGWVLAGIAFRLPHAHVALEQTVACIVVGPRIHGLHLFVGCWLQWGEPSASADGLLSRHAGPVGCLQSTAVHEGSSHRKRSCMLFGSGAHAYVENVRAASCA